jgi:LysM repeat protein
MKFPYLLKRKKLRAATQRVRQERAIDDYDQEPKMKLSSAFIVVLAIHVVFVGGVYAFSSIAAHRKSALAANEKPAAMTEAAPSALDPTAGAEAPPGGEVHKVQKNETLRKIAIQYGVTMDAIQDANGLADGAPLRVGQELRIPEKPAAPQTAQAGTDAQKAANAKPAASVKASPTTYTVAKGDSPVGIARKLGVNYDELLKLNKIDDPKKLQIGQKLRVPAKAAKPATLAARTES